MIDPATIALKRLVEREGGHIAVAEAIDANDQSIYQIVTGVKLPSGRPKGVGPSLRARLTRRYPGWLELATDPGATPSTHDNLPTLSQALEVIGIEMAKPMPDDVRDDVAHALSNLAKRRGLQRDQDQVLALLQAPPEKRQSNGR